MSEDIYTRVTLSIERAKLYLETLAQLAREKTKSI